MMPYRASPPDKVMAPDEVLARTALTPALEDDEELIWAQRPKRGIVFHRRDIYLTFMAVLWIASMLFWGLGAVSKAPPAAIWALPFLLLGLYLLIFRHLIAARQLPAVPNGHDVFAMIIAARAAAKDP